MKISKNSNILILSHFYKRTISGGGPPQEIRDFFIQKVKKIYYIEHPFPYSADRRSSITIYEEGFLKKQIFTPFINGSQIIFYLLDVFFTIYFLLLVKSKFDLCIALDNLNTVSVLPFKKLRLIKKLVYYTIDYTPKRFENKLLNNIYHLIDRIACYNADKVWILSPRMIRERRKNGVNMKKSAKSIILPMGANLGRIHTLPLQKIKRHQIIFVGALLFKQGLQLVIDTLNSLIIKVPGVHLVIVGQGEYEKQLKQLVKGKKLEKYVTFKGFVKSHAEVEKLLCESAIGIAPYVPSSDSYTYFTDPGKPKIYLGCGLPVIITDVPAIARVIRSQKAGLIVDYSTKSLAKALITLLSDDKLYKEYRENAIKLSKNYDTNTLISRALLKVN